MSDFAGDDSASENATNASMWWAPRSDDAVAPLSCCSALTSDSGQYPPTHVDEQVLCVVQGDHDDQYVQQVASPA